MTAPDRSGRRLIPAVVLVYFALLTVSHGVRWIRPDPAPAAPGMKEVVAAETGKGADDAGAVVIRYFDTRPEADPGDPVVLLIHGSPMSTSDVLQPLIRRLEPTGRVIAPDLPGFGFSTRKVPDYGFSAHAEYLRDLLDRLGIRQVHLVAYSMGGGSAIRLAAESPDRVASVALVSAIGVQELELLGEYHLNRALHEAQLLLVTLVQEGIPHFGMLDRVPLNRQYARNFTDADQRPLRGMLRKVVQPTLIWHGRSDSLVPPAAAREHHRLVPQSELVMVDGGHLSLFGQTDRAAADIGEFLARVESGLARTRSEAGPERTAAAREPFGRITLEPATGIMLGFYMALIALATLISEDLACIAAGLMAARGIISFPAAVAASLAGIVIGDMLLFLAGRALGRPALLRAPLRWFVKKETVERSARWFAARGPAIILASRFLPGTRAGTYFAAGMVGSRLSTFTLYFLGAAAIWTPALVGLSTAAGTGLLTYYPFFARWAVWVVVGLILAIFVSTRVVIPLFSFRGRRMLLSRYRRIVRWEFWPLQLFYIPVVAFILLLGLRYRKPVLFTAANPGIPAGGVLGESKTDILDRLRGCGNVAPYILLANKKPLRWRIEQVRRFMSAEGLDYPVVLKPDVGQRGQEVSIVGSDEAVERYLTGAGSDTIVQKYVEGLEYGVFYYRCPGKRKGAILSITDKRRLVLTGDGVSTLETLILKDDRAVCMAPLHFAVHAERLFDVPRRGERITLVEVGTHARGALFLDGSRHMTRALNDAFDRISGHFQGFYFGRYDIRVPTVEDFEKGENLTIVELNGVSSEATHVYDPEMSLFRAWSDLMHQWKTAFEIGAENARRGIRPLTISEFFTLVRSGGKSAPTAVAAPDVRN